MKYRILIFQNRLSRVRISDHEQVLQVVGEKMHYLPSSLTSNATNCFYKSRFENLLCCNL